MILGRIEIARQIDLGCKITDRNYTARRGKIIYSIYFFLCPFVSYVSLPLPRVLKTILESHHRVPVLDSKLIAAVDQVGEEYTTGCAAHTHNGGEAGKSLTKRQQLARS